MSGNDLIDEAIGEHDKYKGQIIDFEAKYHELYAEVQSLKASKSSDNKPNTAPSKSTSDDNSSNQADMSKLEYLEQEILKQSRALHELGASWDYTMRSLEENAYRLNKIEQYSRLYSLLIHGLKNIPNGVKDKGLIFSKWVVDQINRLLPNLPEPVTVQDIDISHPLPTKSKNAKSCVIVKFCRRDIRNMLFYAKRALKGTGVTFSEHLTPVNLALYNEAQKLEGATTWTSQCKIFVKIGDIKNVISCMNDIDLIRHRVTPSNLVTVVENSQNISTNGTLDKNTDMLTSVANSTEFPALNSSTSNHNNRKSARGGAHSNRGKHTGPNKTRGSHSPRGYAHRTGFRF